MQPRKVPELPTLDQKGYMNLPRVPEGKVLYFAGTAWNSYEAESMAAVLIQACIDAGEWKILSTTDIEQTLKKFPMYELMPRDFWNGFHQLHRDEYLEVLEFENAQYAQIRPALVDTALEVGWLYQPARSPSFGDTITFEPIRPRGPLAWLRWLISRS